MIGSVVSHYRVMEKLGSGGMGIVYQAEDMVLKRQVALKFLPENLTNNQQALDRFLREARAAAALNHPYICTIYEVGKHDEQHFIVMELLEGKTLKHHMEGRSLPKEEIVELGMEIAEALEAAHSKGIIHRDIKPANIFVTTRGQAKVLDFGLAKLLPHATRHGAAGQDSANGGTIADELTEPGGTVGTAEYMSPEQVRGQEVDARTDLFSFGAVLYEMATGQRAFSGQTAAVIQEAILNRAPTPLTVGVDIPIRLREIIEKALDKERELRYQSANELRTDLKRLKRDSETSGAHLSVGGRAGRWPHGRGVLISAAIGLCAVAAIFALWWFSRPAPREARALMQRNVTANSPENPVYAAAISPNGRYLAYADFNGVFVRLLDTGETHPLTLPEGFCFRCASLSWFRDGTKLAAVGPGQSGETTGIWAISILGGSPRKLRDDAGRAAVSPDGEHIAYIASRSETEIWVMGANGEDAKKLVQGLQGDHFLQVQWSHDGSRVAYLKSRAASEKSETLIESVPKDGGAPNTLLAVPGLHSFCWSSDGRIMYSMQEPPPNDRDSNLWELRVDRSGAKASGDPRRITNWAGLSVSDLSVSIDSKHLVFVNAGLQRDTYVAALEGKGGLGPLRRITSQGRNNVPSAWTQDGQGLFFYSDRSGNWDIFRQSLQDRNGQDFILGLGEQTEPRVSPDALWVLYWDHVKKEGAASTPMRLLRVSISGGAPEFVLEASPRATVRCAHKSSSCVLSEFDKASGDLVFTALDPLRGRSGELARLATEPGTAPAWDVSPDGSSLAIVDVDEHKNFVRVVELKSGSGRSIAVGHSEKLSGISWSAEGPGWFVTSSSLRGAAIFHVRLNGRISEILTSKAGLGTPLASPDGKNLAFTISTYNSNAWVIENF